jgi:hypothetical protein
MNVPTITMTPEQAEKKLLGYRQYLKHHAKEEYEIAAKAYAAMAKGKVLLNLVDAIQQTGLGEDQRPRLAICRADREEVEVGVHSRDRELVFDALKGRSSWSYEGDLVLRVPFTFSLPVDKQLWFSGFAGVPMIPPEVLPKAALDNFFVLWEVEHWADHSRFALTSRDPFLLRRIVGELYAVEAEWNLTDLEALIVNSIRRRPRS